jgi:uncharacterized membrane protein YdjX (TVP38/TMEM64 family)
VSLSPDSGARLRLPEAHTFVIQRVPETEVRAVESRNDGFPIEALRADCAQGRAHSSVRRTLARFPALLRDRRLWLVVGAVAIVAILRVTGCDRYLSHEVLGTHHSVLMEFVGQHSVAACAIYLSVYVAVVAFSLPGAFLLTLTGGFLFGPVAGTVLTVVGATTGATLVVLFARTVFGGSSLDRFGPQARKLAENMRRNAWSYLLALRLVPLFPFVLVNIIPAFVGVRTLTFLLTTLVGIIPATAVFSLAGAGLGAALERGEKLSLSMILTPEILLALAGLALLALAAIPLRRWLEQKNSETRGG